MDQDPLRQKHARLLVRYADPAVLRSRGVTKEVFAAIYSGGPPWDIGEPQPEVVKIERAGGFRGSVLDVGCGFGENAIYLAQNGYAVHAIDFVRAVVERARDHYREECGRLQIVFEVADALELGRLGRTFDCVLDSGMFHLLSDQQRLAYERSLRNATAPGSIVHVLCFSEEETRTGGPRRIRLDEVHTTFGASWDIRSARSAEYRAKAFESPARAWAIELVRR
jgi:SAM-dependent methyltransferase